MVTNDSKSNQHRHYLFFFRFSSICYLEHCPHLESSVDSRTYLPGAPLAVELVSAGGKLGSVV